MQGCKEWELLFHKYVIVHRFWCLQLFIHVSLQFLTSLKLGHCSKLNWPKRISAVYWLFGTLFYPCWNTPRETHQLCKIHKLCCLSVFALEMLNIQTTVISIVKSYSCVHKFWIKCQWGRSSSLHGEQV